METVEVFYCYGGNGQYFVKTSEVGLSLHEQHGPHVIEMTWADFDRLVEMVKEQAALQP